MIQKVDDRTEDLYLQGGEWYIQLKGENEYQYLGQSSEATLSIDIESIEHKQTERVPFGKDKEIIINATGTMKLVVSQISSGILSLWTGGTETTTAQTAGSIDTTLTVKKGYSYLLDWRNITNLEVKNSDDSVTYVAGVDYEIDKAVGNLTILRGGNIADGDELHITGAYGDAVITTVEALTNTDVEAKLRFVSDALAGSRKIWHFHKCSIKPSGDFAIKSADDFGTIEFEIAVLMDNSIQANDLSKLFKVDSVEVA